MTNTIIPGKPPRPIRVDVQAQPAVSVDASGRIPPGGTAGQNLVKVSDSDFATGWATLTAEASWGSITGTLSAQTDLQSALDGKQPLATVLTNTTAAFTTAQETKLAGIATGATANAADAFLLDRANHTGTQTASTISNFGSSTRAVALTGFVRAGSRANLTATNTVLSAFEQVDKWLADLAPVAFSGSASDLSAGTLPAARFDDTAHGSRAGGALHANAVASGAAGFMTGADKAKLDGIAPGATAFTTEDAQDAVGGMVDASLVYADATPALSRAALTGAITAAQGSNATALGSFTLVQLNTAIADADVATGGGTATGTNTGDQTITLTGDVTGTGTGSFAATIAADAVTNAKLADMATATIKGRATAGTGDPQDLTGTQATALLDTFTAGAKGLVPASGGGTANFLRADGTFAAPPGGGGSPGGSSGEVQWNDGGTFAGAADVEIEGGQLRLPAIATPTAPAAGGVKVFGRTIGAGVEPAFMGPNGLVFPIQADLGEGSHCYIIPNGNGNTVQNFGLSLASSTGTVTTANVAVGSLHQMLRRFDILVTVAATTAVAGTRGNANQFRIGRSAAAPGGFSARIRWAPATGAATATSRAFAGFFPTAAPTDVQPSSRANIIGMGFDAADTNIQFMHNDGSGTATKIDLGASFPVPTVDRSQVYELQLYSPNSLTQSVSYRVIRFDTTGKTIAAEASGTVTTDLPAVTQLLAPLVAASVGGTSSVIGITLFGIAIATEY